MTATDAAATAVASTSTPLQDAPAPSFFSFISTFFRRGHASGANVDPGHVLMADTTHSDGKVLVQSTAWLGRRGIALMWVSFAVALAFLVLALVLKNRKMTLAAIANRQNRNRFAAQQQQKQQQQQQKRVAIPGRVSTSQVPRQAVFGNADDTKDEDEFAVQPSLSEASSLEEARIAGGASIIDGFSAWMKRVDWTTVCFVCAGLSGAWFVVSLLMVMAQGGTQVPVMTPASVKSHGTQDVAGAVSNGDEAQVIASGSILAFPDRIELIVYGTTALVPTTQIGAAAQMQQQTNSLLVALSQQAHVPLSDISVQASSSQLTSGGGAITYGGVDYMIASLPSPAYVAMQTVMIDTPFQPDHLNALLRVLSNPQISFRLTFSLQSQTQALHRTHAEHAATTKALELAYQTASQRHATVGNLLSLDVNNGELGSPIVKPLTFHSNNMRAEEISRVIDPLSPEKIVVSAQVVARYQLLKI